MLRTFKDTDKLLDAKVRIKNIENIIAGLKK